VLDAKAQESLSDNGVLFVRMCPRLRVAFEHLRDAPWNDSEALTISQGSVHRGVGRISKYPSSFEVRQTQSTE
jgi:hypothetical protein